MRPRPDALTAAHEIEKGPLGQSIIPYGRSPIFDETSIPQALLSRHNTRDGVWAVIRVLEGNVTLHIADQPSLEIQLNETTPAVVAPRQIHWVELNGSMRLQLEFFDSDPSELHHK